MAATNRVRGGHRTAGLRPLENLARLKIVPSKTVGYEVLIDSDDRPRLLDYLGSSYRQRFSHSGWTWLSNTRSKQLLPSPLHWHPLTDQYSSTAEENVISFVLNGLGR